jgi:hypothetical protein
MLLFLCVREITLTHEVLADHAAFCRGDDGFWD